MPDRIAALEGMLSDIEAANDPNLLESALGDLYDACCSAGQLARAYEPLHKRFRLYADHPAVERGFASDLPLFLIKSFCWRVCLSPDLSRAQIEHTLSEMERVYAFKNTGMSAVHGAHLNWAMHSGDAHAAAERYRQHRACPPGSGLDDCDACVASQWANYHLSLGDDQGAVDHFQFAFDNPGNCCEQPRRGLADALLPLVRLGRLAEAREAHIEGFAMVRDDDSYQYAIARHLEFLARTGNETRGLNLLRAHARMLSAGENPHDRMHLLASAALLLSRIIALTGPNTPVPGPQGRGTAELVARYARGEALRLAACFDARNGTDHQTTIVGKVIVARPLGVTLRLGLGKESRPEAPIIEQPRETGRADQQGDDDVEARFEAVLQAEDADADHLAAVARFNLATAYSELDCDYEAAEYYRATLESLPDNHESDLRLRAMLALIDALDRTGYDSAAGQYSLRASRLTESFGDLREAAELATNAADSFSLTGEYREAAGAYQRSTDLRISLDDFPKALWEQHEAIALLARADLFEESLAALDHAVAITDRLRESAAVRIRPVGDRGSGTEVVRDPVWHRANNAYVKAQLLNELGHESEALPYAEEAESSHRDHGHLDDAAKAAMCVARIADGLGDREKAVAAMNRAAELAETENVRREASRVRQNLDIPS
jgi:tetratricopeptide (TPR) repeat protein